MNAKDQESNEVGVEVVFVPDNSLYRLKVWCDKCELSVEGEITTYMLSDINRIPLIMCGSMIHEMQRTGCGHLSQLYFLVPPAEKA